MSNVIGVYRRSSAVALLFLLPAFAEVTGTVTNKTTNQPQAGATVTLYKLGGSGMESVESVKSGPDGKFVINQPVQGPHLIQTAFDGVTYNHMLPPGTPSTGVSLDVYNSSTKIGGARVMRHFLIFQPGASEMVVNEGFMFHNAGPTTYNDPDGGTLHLYLPPDIEGKATVRATAPQGMPVERAPEKTGDKNVYKVDFAIKPGDTSFELTYKMPYTGTAIYDGKVLYKTDEPTLLVAPNGVTLKADNLQAKGEEPQSHAKVYAVTGSDYKVEVGGVMPAASDDAASEGPSMEEIMPKVWDNMPWILALAFGILALGFIVLYRAQPAAAVAKGQNERGSR